MYYMIWHCLLYTIKCWITADTAYKLLPNNLLFTTCFSVVMNYWTIIAAFKIFVWHSPNQTCTFIYLTVVLSSYKSYTHFLMVFGVQSLVNSIISKNSAQVLSFWQNGRYTQYMYSQFHSILLTAYIQVHYSTCHWSHT